MYSWWASFLVVSIFLSVLSLSNFTTATAIEIPDINEAQQKLLIPEKHYFNASVNPGGVDYFSIPQSSLMPREIYDIKSSHYVPARICFGFTNSYDNHTECERVRFSTDAEGRVIWNNQTLLPDKRDNYILLVTAEFYGVSYSTEVEKRPIPYNIHLWRAPWGIPRSAIPLFYILPWCVAIAIGYVYLVMKKKMFVRLAHWLINSENPSSSAKKER